MVAEQIDIFGGITDVTPAPKPQPKPAAPATTQLGLFDLDAGEWAGQTVAVDPTFVGLADDGAEVHGHGLLTW